MFSPLSQFDIISVISIFIKGYDFSISNMVLTVGFFLLVFIVILNIIKIDIRLIPKS